MRGVARELSRIALTLAVVGAIVAIVLIVRYGDIEHALNGASSCPGTPTYADC